MMLHLCKKLTDEQSKLVSDNIGAAYSYATRFADLCGIRGAVRDDFLSAAHDALMVFASRYDSTRSRPTTYLWRFVKSSCIRKYNEIANGGLVYFREENRAYATRIPAGITGLLEYGESIADSDNDEIDFDDAFSAISEHHQSILRQAIDGERGVDVARSRGTTKQNEYRRLKRARNALLAAMGEPQCV